MLLQIQYLLHLVSSCWPEGWLFWRLFTNQPLSQIHSPSRCFNRGWTTVTDAVCSTACVKGNWALAVSRSPSPHPVLLQMLTVRQNQSVCSFTRCRNTFTWQQKGVSTSLFDQNWRTGQVDGKKKKKKAEQPTKVNDIFCHLVALIETTADCKVVYRYLRVEKKHWVPQVLYGLNTQSVQSVCV